MSKNRYKLLPNESIIMKQDRIFYGGMFANFTSELLLTNLNLVLINKGTFGNVKGIKVLPLNQIKTFDNNVQIILSKKRNAYPQIEVYLENGQENFGFQSKRIAKHWMESINKVVNNETVEIGSAPKPEIPGLDKVTDVLGTTYGKFKDAFGSESVQEQERESSNYISKCKFCGAPLPNKSGIRHCSYCDSKQ